MAEVVFNKEQAIAKKAYNAVTSVKGTKTEEKYKQAAITFPALLHNNGLCQAIAFYQSDKDGKKCNYLNDLAKILGFADNTALAEATKDYPLEEYMHLTRQAMQTASWIKRYSQSFLKDDEEGRAGGES